MLSRLRAQLVAACSRRGIVSSNSVYELELPLARTSDLAKARLVGLPGVGERIISQGGMPLPVTGSSPATGTQRSKVTRRQPVSGISQGDGR